MTRGTRSVLWGAHGFLWHPLFVARAWWHLYGFPWDPRLWACFYLHDIGYIGKTAMDSDEGERHPEVGAAVIGRLFGERWGQFCLFHSRHYAKRFGQPPSKLCFADKLAFVYTPRWFYLLTVNTDELMEYMLNGKQTDPVVWHQRVCAHTIKWVANHKDGQPDLVTPVRHPNLPESAA